MKKTIACMLSLVLMALPLGINAQTSHLEVIFLDVGKADAIVILTDNSTVLIDAGTDKMGKRIVSFFEKKGIERVDVMIITHFDKDHVGGADIVLEALPVGVIIEPAYEKDSKQYREYVDAIEQTQVRVENLGENMSFELDGVGYAIDVANDNYYGKDEENDFSLVTSLSFGSMRFLFAGDAENPRLAELIDEGDLSHDVLKVPHHGRAEKLSAAFFREVSPRYAVITSDEKNPEDEEVVALLRQLYAEVLLTREGDISIRTDGENITFSQDKGN